MTSPRRTASQLRRIADNLEASSNPSRELVAKDIKRVVAGLTLADAEGVHPTVIEFVGKIEEVFKKHFPQGYFGFKTGGYNQNDIYIATTTLPKGEQTNGIIHNDPCYSTFWMFGSYTDDGLNDRIKVEMSLGNKVFGRNYSNPTKVGWRNGTAVPATIIKKFDRYFSKVKELVDAFSD